MPKNKIEMYIIPFSLNIYGHIIISSAINGVDGKFIFDTGAGINVIFKAFSKKICSQVSHNFFVGHRATGEEIFIPLFYPSHFSVSNLELNNSIFGVIDKDIIKNVDGLISLKSFQDKVVIIDYKNKELKICNSIDKDYKFINIQINNFTDKALDIFTYITLNEDIRIQVLLDSGSGVNSFWISDKFSNFISEKKKIKSKIIVSEFNKQSTNIYSLFQIKSLNTENNEVKILNPKILFVENLIYEGKLGLEWLGNEIAIDVRNKKIFIIS